MKHNLEVLFSNIVLDEFGKELGAIELRFTRYVDDCIILVVISKAADKVIENVSKLIEKKLGHKINMTKSKISKPNTIKYLGFGFNYVIFAKLWKAKLHSKFIETLLKEKLKRLTKRSWSVKWE